MPWKPYELIWAHIFMFLLWIYVLYSNVTYKYPVSCLVEINYFSNCCLCFLNNSATGECSALVTCVGKPKSGEIIQEHQQIITNIHAQHAGIHYVYGSVT